MKKNKLSKKILVISGIVIVLIAFFVVLSKNSKVEVEENKGQASSDFVQIESAESEFSADIYAPDKIGAKNDVDTDIGVYSTEDVNVTPEDIFVKDVAVKQDESEISVPDLNLVSVSLSVSGKSYDEKVENGATVFAMMQKLSADQDFTFKSKSFTGIGQFVYEINGAKDGSGKYWILYVNEKEAQVGASDYKLYGGENIQWKLESGL